MTRKRSGRGVRGGGGQRASHVRVKTAGRRSASSTRWLERQLNDPYVSEAGKRGYRSRAAFKLKELDARFRLLKTGARVVDLGAAPGGWTQVAVEHVGARGRVVSVDLAEMEAVPGATVLKGDILDVETEGRVREALEGEADVVLSDMAAPTTGHAATDHLRTMALVEAGYEFARQVLAEGGAFVAKVFQGGTEHELLAEMKRNFASVRHAKPPASRAGSVELYLVATGFRRLGKTGGM